jgi:hypothetical protein
VYRLAKRLTDLGVPTPTGKPRWNAASVRGILRNPAYTGRALTNRTRVVPARQRRSALLPVGSGQSHAPRPAEEWIAVPVPQIVAEETFAQVQAKLDTNQQGAARNTRHEYLLRALVSCGVCRLSCTVRQTQPGYRYYLCRGRTDALRVARGSGAPLAPPLPSSWTTWSGRTCARCSLTPPRSPVRWSGRGVGHGCPKSSTPAGRPSARPWASWSANSSGCWTPTWPG